MNEKIASWLLITAILLPFALAANADGCNHNWGTTWAEVAHPHYYYHICSICGAYEYTGGHATKNHGDGSWGSWTCPDCGTHTFEGQTCTTGGSCVCGATVGPRGHSYISEHYTAHPHYVYYECVECGNIYYTGETESFSNICMECGPENIFTITNAFSNKYISANNNYSFNQVASTSSTSGKELWRFYKNSDGTYYIESLGVRSAYGLSKSVLTASAYSISSTTGTLTLAQLDSSNNKQKWLVGIGLNGYIFTNYYYSNLKIATSSGSADLVLSASATYNEWRISSHIYNDYFFGSYNSSPPYVINVIVEPSAITEYLTEDVYSCATAWNGIDDNIYLRYYPSTYTGTYASANFTILVRGANMDNIYGMMSPSPSNNNSNWSSAIIYISLDSSATNNNFYSLNDKQMNFLHELGHALKMAHPAQATEGWRPLAIMNQGLPTNNIDIPSRPSGYDEYNLSRKW